jgi:thymidylate kinase
MARLNYEVISIEGNIGSGKSTLMKYLKEHFKNDNHVIFLKEPVD